MRLVLTPACVEHAGRDVRWPDGVLRGPEGEDLRQVAVHGALYTCSTWCSRDGTMYDRIHDPFQRAFVWSQSKSMCVDARTGAFQVCVGTGSAARVVRLVRAIAMAWIEAPRSAAKLQAVVCTGTGASAPPPVLWIRTGVREYELLGDDDPMPEPHAVPDATWRPLAYAWHDASGRREFALAGADARPTSYLVSPDGWLYSPFSRTATRGVRSPDQRLWATIEDHGLVWIDVAVLCSFVGLPDVRDGARPVAAHANGVVDDNRVSNLRWEHTAAPLAPGVVRTVASLRCSGATLLATADAERVSSATIWSRLGTALSEGAAAERAAVAALVPRSVVECVAGAMRRTDAAERLTDLATAVEDHPSLRSLQDPTGRIGVVRLARIVALDAERRTAAADDARDP